MNLKELLAAIQPGVHLPHVSTGHMLTPFESYLDCLGSMEPDASFFAFGLLSGQFWNEPKEHFLSLLHEDPNFSASLLNMVMIIDERSQKNPQNSDLAQFMANKLFEYYCQYLEETTPQTLQFLKHANDTFKRNERYTNSNQFTVLLDKVLLKNQVPKASTIAAKPLSSLKI